MVKTMVLFIFCTVPMDMFIFCLMRQAYEKSAVLLSTSYSLRFRFYSLFAKKQQLGVIY